jgi:hypothetical protein
VKGNPVAEARGTVLTWAIVSSKRGLPRSRYLGELRELPDAHAPGDWCDIVVCDGRGEMRWTLLAVERGRTPSIFAERRGAHAHDDSGAPQRPEGSRVWEARSQRLFPAPAHAREPVAAPAPALLLSPPRTAWRAGRRS